MQSARTDSSEPPANATDTDRVTALPTAPLDGSSVDNPNLNHPMRHVTTRIAGTIAAHERVRIASLCHHVDTAKTLTATGQPITGHHRHRGQCTRGRAAHPRPPLDDRPEHNVTAGHTTAPPSRPNPAPALPLGTRPAQPLPRRATTRDHSAHAHRQPTPPRPRGER